MSGHLVVITLGPVQEFIAQARRTRDLWFGSFLLSELSRAAAYAMAEQNGVQLVFPAFERGDDELYACDAERAFDPASYLNVANKIVAEVPEGTDPEAVAKQAREAVFACWQKYADRCCKACPAILVPNIQATWKEQIDSLIEFTAAWHTVGDDPEDYWQTRTALDDAIQSRKHLREFSPWVKQRGGVPKSSLDGMRETVLADPRQNPALERHRRRWRISDGEQLDAVGLIKRTGGNPEKVIPIANIAMAAWLQQVVQVLDPRTLDRLLSVCRNKGISRIDRPDIGWVEQFPIDALVLVEDRWPDVLMTGVEGEQDEQGWRRWGEDNIRRVLNELREKKLSSPHPYVACLMADGDHMGDTLQKMTHPEHHRIFSRHLAAFAQNVRHIVEQRHRGSLVYSGGDDALAFVCLPDALKCALALRDDFSACMDAASQELSIAKPPMQLTQRPTLSVGIGIGHMLIAMGELLDLGRQAERQAKDAGRNALAILLDKRSGGWREWRSSWDDCPVKRLAQDITLLAEGKLSVRKIFQVETGLRRFPKPEVVEAMGEEASTEWARTLRLDVERTLSRLHGEEPLDLDEAGLTMDQDRYEARHQRVTEWLNRVIVALEIRRGEVKA